VINGPGTDTPTGLYEEEGGATSLFYSRGGGDRGREQLLAEGPLTRALTLEVSKHTYCIYVLEKIRTAAKSPFMYSFSGNCTASVPHA
jgi:hypothetical protein